MKILFGADLVPKGDSEKLFIKGDVKTLFNDVADLAKTADRFIVNLECALTKSENAIKKFGPNLKVDPACADTIKALGVTDIALANNHVFDFGVEGLQDTLKNLERVGLPYTGVGANDEESRKIYYIEQNGQKIAIVNVCEHEYTYALPDRMGANPYDPYLTMQDIRLAKKNADHVVVIYHGGKEHCRYPSPRLRNLCRETVLCGASVVLCQHSHCIGCYEEYEGCHIVYGQGNFHFWYNDKDEMWNTSLLVEVDFEKEAKIKFYPVEMKSVGISIAKGERADEIMKPFEERNQELQNGKWRDGWHEFCEESEKWYKTVVLTAGSEAENESKIENFAHYLDCEAHTDVWREIFRTWNHTNEK